jgi:hypothetical protein
MTKGDAVNAIIFDARADRSSPTSYRRMLRALRVLGLTEEEQQEALWHLDYLDADRNPYPRYLEPNK